MNYSNGHASHVRGAKCADPNNEARPRSGLVDRPRLTPDRSTGEVASTQLLELLDQVFDVGSHRVEFSLVPRFVLQLFGAARYGKVVSCADAGVATLSPNTGGSNDSPVRKL